jgi:aryl-alcohol dehydrogenase-like predicted oxidoreductase
MKIGSIVIHCHDFDRTVAFWQAALHYVPREPAKDGWVVAGSRQGMQYKQLSSLGEVSLLGLGCGGLGSLTRPRTRRESLALIVAAVDSGITLFDTADIYAQGESERLLGEALRSTDARIITKAGQQFPLTKRVLLPLRGVAKSLLAHSAQARAAAIAVRAKPLRRNYTPEYLRRAVLRSLARLRREQVDIFLLHSPSAADLADGEALDCLSALKQEGLARCIGVSCDDQATLAIIASDKRVEVIEAPFGPNRQDLLVDLKRAAERGAIVIAREILARDLKARQPAAAALSFCLAEPAIAVALIGTTDARHLDEAIRAVGSI